MRAVIAAAGEVPPEGHDGRVALLSDADLVVAADSGLGACVAHDIWPHVLIGDLDSVEAEMLAQARERAVTIIEHPTDKDVTDLQLAIEHAVAAGATVVQVLAPFGSRIDHELANLAHLASHRYASLDVSAHDGRRSVWVVRGQRRLTEPVGTTLSLLPWGGDATGVTTAGLRWPLRDERLAFGATRGVSNVCAEPLQTVEVASGVVLAIVDRSPDGGPLEP